MDKKLMLQALEARAEDYRLSHPTTAEMDITIFRYFSSGKTAVHIAMEIPCSESTVYRALRRVREYLRVPDMDNLLKILRCHVAENPPHFGDWDAQSVLEMLYVAYGEYNRFESDESKAGFDDLYAYLRELPLKKVDCVIDKVCDIVHYHERDGFTEGLKLGVRLGDELRS